MSYDFSRLDSEEFEDLAADVVAGLKGVIVERYKKGKDQGIDGKFTFQNGKVGIIQAKHWQKSTFKSLLSYVESTESEKLKKLTCDSYVFVTSQNLSHHNKLSIIGSFNDNRISSTENVIGFDEIVSFIKNNPEVERKHYKLWLSSVGILDVILHNDVLGESDFTLSEIHEQSKLYYPTNSHYEAIEMIELNSVVVITGLPGIGKTTLAKNVCLYYVGKGYQLVDTGTKIKNASRLFSSSDGDKQIFYYDDFLGKNIIDVTSEKEDTDIMTFIQRVKRHPYAKIVLTSRSNILNGRKHEVEIYDEKKLYKNEYEIKFTKLSSYEKARILYSHMYHSSISVEYLNEILKKKFYREIVTHNNFSPRIIEYLLDVERLQDDSVEVEGYKAYIKNSLNNPSKIWDKCFEKQSYILKKLIMLVALHWRASIDEDKLQNAYETIKLVDDKTRTSSGPDCFIDSVRVISGSMISRSVNRGHATYTTYNPSIVDYLLNKYKDEPSVMASLYSCYDERISLFNLSVIYKKTPKLLKKILDRIVDIIESVPLSKSDDYLEKLITLSVDNSISIDQQQNKNVKSWLLKLDYSTYTPSDIESFNNVLIKFYHMGLKLLSNEQVVGYLSRCIDNSNDSHDLLSVSALIDIYDIEGDIDLVESLSESLDDVLHDSFPDIINDTGRLDDYMPNDESDAEGAIADELNDIMAEFLPSVSVDTQSILDTIDIETILEENAENYHESRASSYHARSVIHDSYDEIDDIFNGFDAES